MATELADYLAGKGVPFRTAHEIVGKIVRDAADRNVPLTSLPLGTLRKYAAQFGPDVVSYLDFQAAIDRKARLGGTATRQVHRRLRELSRKRSDA